MADAIPTPAQRFTLRQLPLPAKLVITVFLLAVGLGYCSAMVQLHMQHSDRDGTTLPTKKNVIAVFAGKRWHAGENEPVTKEMSKLEAIISGDPNVNDLTAKNMTPAFYHLDEANFEKRKKDQPTKVKELIAERDGERLAVIAWINSAPGVRKRAYDTDKFQLPKELVGKPLTQGFKAPPEGVKITTILKARCIRCHQPGGEKQDTPLITLEQLEQYMPREPEVPAAGGWVDSGRIMSLEKLTQSTHAHLLTFAVLFGLTGLVFAFTSYPGFIRGIIGPIVLVAQVADISCWWLARLDPPYGPAFAMCIIGTGGIVGLGLMTQIVLSLFNMYGPKGKVVLLLLFALSGGLGGWAYVKVIKPALEQEEQDKKDEANGNGNGAKPPAPPTDGPKPPVVAAGPSSMQIVLEGKFPDAKEWGKKPGGMVRAFYDKEDGSDFRSTMKEGTEEEQQKLIAERRGEHDAVLAWIKLADAARKTAYEEDKFPLPAELAAKPMTADYKDGNAAKIKTIINDRCNRCHSPDGDQADIPLDTYAGILEKLKPAATADK